MHIIYFDDNINLFDLKSNKLYKENCTNNELRIGKINNETNFIKKLNKLLKINSLFSLYRKKELLIIVNNFYNISDINNLIRIFNDFDYKNIKVIREIDTLYKENNDLYIFLYDNYYYIYYFDNIYKPSCILGIDDIYQIKYYKYNNLYLIGDNSKIDKFYYKKLKKYFIYNKECPVIDMYIRSNKK